jgi:hypothetical protein
MDNADNQVNPQGENSTIISQALHDVRGQDMVKLLTRKATSRTALDRILSDNSWSEHHSFNNYISSVDPDSSIE